MKAIMLSRLGDLRLVVPRRQTPHTEPPNRSTSTWFTRPFMIDRQQERRLKQTIKRIKLEGKRG